MKNAEDRVLDDEEKGSQSDEASVVSNAEQNQDLNLDDSSVLDELQAMYSDLDLSDGEHDSVSESDSAGTSIMDELEAMYGSFSESTNNDEKTSREEHEPVAENVSALAELEALLGESAESGNNVESGEAFPNSSYEHLFENKESVLDELQNLLQKSIEELEASADDHSMDAKYPSRNELKTLLEDKLSQLMMISDGSESPGFDEGSSILDELNALMKETGSDTNASDSYLSSTLSDDLPGDEDIDVSDDIDEYISAMSSSYEDTPDDEVADSVLNEFESLLSGSTDTMESEVVADVLPGSTIDEKLDADLTQKAEVDSSLDVLEQLEEMLAETAGTENNEISDDINIKAVETDFVINHELPELSAKAKENTIDEIKAEERSALKEKERASEVQKNRLIQQSLRKAAYLSDETENKKLSPLWGVLSVAFVIVGVLVFWNMFDQGNEQDKLAENRVVAVPQALLEENATSEFSEKSDDITEEGTIRDLLTSLQASKHEQKYSFDSELSSIAEQSYVDEASSNEESVPGVEIELPVQPIEPVIAESSAEPVIEDAKAKAQNIWSVHLMSYYNKPPQASELKFLDVAGIPYKIEKVILDGEGWYRVLVNKSSEYRIAKEYADTLRKTLGIKEIWISKSQDVD